jgi:ribosomal-protein-alanine N-acetyltransferase
MRPCIRRLEPHDVGQVLAIERASNPHPWSGQLFRRELDLPAGGRTWLVAVDGEAVVGFIGAVHVDDEVHVMNLAVDPAARQRGIGGSLLAALVDAAVANGARHLTLEVRPSNQAALALYRRFGLGPAGALRRYYPDGEDALVLRARDIDGPGYRRRLARCGVAR